MGPSIIFDKSALQSLSIDETVWFDQFLMGNITPLFYVETLADLEKAVKQGKTPEQVVGDLAAKTPYEAVPNVHHRTIILQELAGNPSTMDRRPLVMGGTPKTTPDGKLAIHFDEFPEAAALNRWQKGEFIEVERAVAKDWRRELAQQDSDSQIGKLKNILPADQKISNLVMLKEFIDTFCHQSDKHVLDLMMDILDIPKIGRPRVIQRWELANRPPIDEFAPYATHVFKVDLVYYLGIFRGFISGVRPSNKADMAYLYYLPFTMAFVSGDNLHARTVPLFLNEDQSYIPASDLKATLKALDAHFDKLPDEIKKRGVMQFIGYPPSDLDNVVTKLWDKHMRPDWRKISKESEEQLLNPDKPPHKKSATPIMENMDKSTPFTGDRAQINDDNVDQVFLKRTMPVHRGKWRMVSQEVVDSAKDQPEIE